VVGGPEMWRAPSVHSAGEDADVNRVAQALTHERRIPLDVLAETMPDLAARLRAEGKTEARALHAWEIQEGLHEQGKMKGDAWKRLALRGLLARAAEKDVDLLTWSTGEDRFKKWGSQRVDWKRGLPPTPQWERTPTRSLLSVKGELFGVMQVDNGTWRIEGAGRQPTGQYETSRESAEDYVVRRLIPPEVSRQMLETTMLGEGSGWTVSAQEQTGGEHAGMNIEEEARERGQLLETKGQTVRTKDDLRRVIESIKRGDETNVDKLTDRIWDRMQTEDEGTSLPRKEFFEFLYDQSFRNETSKIVKKLDKGIRVGRVDLRAGIPANAIPLTDTLREKVQQGQPLYTRTPLDSSRNQEQTTDALQRIDEARRQAHERDIARARENRTRQAIPRPVVSRADTERRIARMGAAVQGNPAWEANPITADHAFAQTQEGRKIVAIAGVHGMPVVFYRGGAPGANGANYRGTVYINSAAPYQTMLSIMDHEIAHSRDTSAIRLFIDTESSAARLFASIYEADTGRRLVGEDLRDELASALAAGQIAQGGVNLLDTTNDAAGLIDAIESYHGMGEPSATGQGGQNERGARVSSSQRQGTSERGPPSDTGATRRGGVAEDQGVSGVGRFTRSTAAARTPGVTPEMQARFRELTKTWTPGGDWKAWKRDNPDKIKALNDLRADVLKAQGYDTDTPLYHSTGDESRPLTTLYKMPLYLSSSKAAVEQFLGRPNAQKVYMREGLRIANIGASSFIRGGSRRVEVLKEEGYDGLRGVMEGTQRPEVKDYWIGGKQEEIAIFDPRKHVKSAEVAPDDTGRIPPPSEWGDAGTPDIRFSRSGPVTPEQDAAYLAAVEAGDTATAQRMVDDAAERAGYDSGELWHGTDELFTRFDMQRSGTRNAATDLGTMAGGGMSLTPDRKEAQTYGNRVMRVYVAAPTYAQVQASPLDVSSEDIARAVTKARNENPDLNVVVLQKWMGGTEVVVFRPEQIKLADPVTRDDAGRVIPLSERFNPQSNDIRFSRSIPPESEQPAKKRAIPNRKGKSRATASQVELATMRAYKAVADAYKAMTPDEQARARQLLAVATSPLSMESRKGAADLVTKLANTVRDRGFKAGKAVEREKSREKVKSLRATLPKKVRQKEQEKRIVAFQKATGEPYEGKVQTPYAMFRAAVKLGVAEQVDRDFPKAMRFAIDKVFEEAAKPLKGKERAPQSVRAITGLARDIGELNRRVDSIPGEAERTTALKIGLQALLGRDHYMMVRRATLGDIEKSIRMMQERAQFHLNRYFGRGIAQLLSVVNPNNLFKYEGAETGFRDEWLSIVDQLGDLRVKAKGLRDAKEFMGKLRQLKAGEPDIQAQRDKILKMQSDLEDALAKSGRDWSDMEDIWTRLSEIKAESEAMQKKLKELRSETLNSAQRKMAESVNRNNKPLKSNRNKAPWYKRWVYDYRGGPLTWVLQMSGENDSLMERAFIKWLREGESKAKGKIMEVVAEFEQVMSQNGLSWSKLDSFVSKSQKVEVNGEVHDIPNNELMDQVGNTLDSETPVLLAANGTKESARRDLNDPVRDIMRAQTDADDPMQYVDRMTALVPDEYKNLVRWMSKTLTDMGADANKTMLKVLGHEVFFSPSYWPRTVDRSASGIDSENMDFSKFKDYLMEHLGLTKSRVTHKNPVILGNAINKFFDHLYKMAYLTHMLEAQHGTLKMLDAPELRSAIVSNFGRQRRRMMKDTIYRVTGMKHHADNWNGIQRRLAAVRRRMSVSILGFRFLSSGVKNWIPGQILLSNELGKVNRKYLVAMLRPSILTGKSKWRQGYEDVMSQGVLKSRWTMDPAMTYANLPDIGEAANMISLRKRRWTMMALQYMSNRERHNAIKAYLMLRRDGIGKEEALDIIEDATRKTQNPSSALDETGLYTAISEAPTVSLAFPFFGQPTVQSTMLLNDSLRVRNARRAGKHVGREFGNLASTVFAIAANAGFNAILLYALRALRQDPMDDDEEKKARNRWMAIMIGASELLDSVFMPGSGRIAYPLMELAKSIKKKADAGDDISAVKEASVLLRRFTDEVNDNLILRAAGKATRGFDDIVRGMDDQDEARMLRGVVDLADTVGMATGLPTGGLVQMTDLIAGITGNPLEKGGFEDDDYTPSATMPNRAAPRPIRLPVPRPVRAIRPRIPLPMRRR